MFLTNVNLTKIVSLYAIQMYDNITLEGICSLFVKYGVTDVSKKLLFKTIISMVEDDWLVDNNKRLSITETGRNEYERLKNNLPAIIQLLFSTEIKSSKLQYNLDILEGIKAFKTVPYQTDSLKGLSDEDYFKLVAKECYTFGNRGMGKAKLNSGNKLLQYDYKGYAILFSNGGMCHYIGVVDSYCNDGKLLYLSQVIRLEIPISAWHIHENVRFGFKMSQQKQEFYVKEEVDAMIMLIKNNISNYGCEVFK